MRARDPRAPAIAARLRAAGCVFAEEEAAVILASARSPRELEPMVAARVEGRPLEHVVGWAEFCGLRLIVVPGTFVPRARTELLAREAVRVARRRPHAVVVDMCCGVGAVSAVVAARARDVEIHACDIDPVAVRCARRNVPAAKVRAGDLFDPLPARLRGRIDVLAANTPYVPTRDVATMPREARLHEPRAALDGGDDGLDVVRRVVAAAPSWLAPGGALLVEVSARQAPAVAELMVAAGLRDRLIRSTTLDATVAAGRRQLAQSAPTKRRTSK